MNAIQAQLGHSSLATTSRYLAHIAPAELVKAM
jgi:integrase